jgi:hypothetical protein
VSEIPWACVPFGNLVAESQNGCGTRRGESGTPTVVLRLADVSTTGDIAQDGLREVILEDSQSAKYALSTGDLLVFRVNGSRSITGSVVEYRGPTGYAYCDHFIRIILTVRPTDEQPRMDRLITSPLSERDGESHVHWFAMCGGLFHFWIGANVRPELRVACFSRVSHVGVSDAMPFVMNVAKQIVSAKKKGRNADRL